MPYDKDGKYYRKAVVPPKKEDSVDDFLKKSKKQANILAILVLAGIVGGLGAILFWPKKELPKPNMDLQGAERYYDLCLQLRDYKGLSKDGCETILENPDL